MTVFASRSETNAENAKLSITYGPVTATVEEHRSHLRSFHDQLGRLLDEMEADAKPTG
jgi:hypothetical protein